MVFQSYALFPHLSVAENILFGLKVRKVPAAERDARLARVAELLGLGALLARKPSQLSGGQQQRVALGRAIIAEAPVCLMDEPLSNLDAQLRAEMRGEIRALQTKLGITMVYVTHDQVEAMSMADRVILLNAGRIEQNGAPADLYEHPANTFVARFIGTPPMNLLRLAARDGGAVVDGTDGSGGPARGVRGRDARRAPGARRVRRSAACARPCRASSTSVATRSSCAASATAAWPCARRDGCPFAPATPWAWIGRGTPSTISRRRGATSGFLPAAAPPRLPRAGVDRPHNGGIPC